jgi:endonuclease-3
LLESTCRAVFTRFAAINPYPKTELLYTSNFELLIAVMLSAQATDKSVNLATRELFRFAPTPEAMLTLGLSGVESSIQRIGLYKTKARHVLATCEQLITLHHSTVPGDRDALEALPGVGRKTANVVLNTAFGLPVMAVDTHIFRVANRTGMAPGKNVNQVEQALMKIIPNEYLQHAHHWLILHGRYTCTARKPRCEACLIADLCQWPDKVIPVK